MIVKHLAVKIQIEIVHFVFVSVRLFRLLNNLAAEDKRW